MTVIRLVLEEIADKDFACELRTLLAKKHFALDLATREKRTPLQSEVLTQLGAQIRKIDAHVGTTVEISAS